MAVERAIAELALYGGKPIRERYLPYGRHTVSEEDIDSVVEVLRSDWLTTGPAIARFEEALAKFVGAKYAVAFSSGTAALHGAVFASGLEPGDRAITSPLTFCATANCVLYQGGQPVFADVEERHLTLDPGRVSELVDDRTKLILPVDFAGHPAALDEVLAIADERGLVVIEDACHALGAEYKSEKVGSISHMTVFSFHPVKHIATGEGGMVTTDDPEMAEKLVLFRNQGIDRAVHDESAPWHYEVAALGYNYRISDIACALGYSQFKSIDYRLERRKEIADRYDAAFADIKALQLPRRDPRAESAWHLYAVRFRSGHFKVDRAEIFRALRAENIGVQVHYIPVHYHPYYRKRLGTRQGLCRIAERAYEELISLPLWPGMVAGDIEDVINGVAKIVDAYRI